VRSRRKFKHALSGHNVVTGLSMGSQGMPGMGRVPVFEVAAATFAAGLAKAGHAEVSLFAGASWAAPGMAKAAADGAGGSAFGSDNVRGAHAGGKSLHQGATFVTAGSLNAPGMAKQPAGVRPASLETLGAAAGSAYAAAVDATGFYGTLLTNGSANAPGMAHHKAGGGSGAAAAHLSKSVDTGLSLFAMGSALSQAKAAEARLKMEREAEQAEMAADAAATGDAFSESGGFGGGAGGEGAAVAWNGGGMTSHVPGSNTFGSTMRMQPSADLPLWSLGSSVSVAALAETGGRRQQAANAASSNTFGATMAGASGGYAGAQNAAIPLWSLGSATAPGMQRLDATTAAGVRTNCSSAAPSAAPATLLSFGSSGAPGMTRDKVAAEWSALPFAICQSPSLVSTLFVYLFFATSAAPPPPPPLRCGAATWAAARSPRLAPLRPRCSPSAPP
jgi:hypothetical protein